MADDTHWMTEKEERTAFHGLCRSLVNFPKKINEFPFDLPFADEKEVRHLSKEEGKDIVAATSDLSGELLYNGYVKLKLNDVEDKDKKWESNWKSLRNEHKRKGNYKKPSDSETIISTHSQGFANLPPLFVMIKEIRNLGDGILVQHHYDPAAAVKRLPCLDGITNEHLIRFYEYLFGVVHEDNKSSCRDWVKRYYSILDSLPEDPGEKYPGLIIPYIHSFNDIQINNDVEVHGVEQQSIAGSLLDLYSKEVDGQRVGNYPGINYPMIFYGYGGSGFSMHIEYANAPASLNHVLFGCPKFWNCIVVRYCEKLRIRVQSHLRKMRRKGMLSEYLAKQADYVCLMQHKKLILTERFFYLYKDDPIPYSIVIQRKSEAMMIGAGVHHQGGNMGSFNIARAVNLVHGDYHLAVPASLKQCDGHSNAPAPAFLLTSEQINTLNEDSKRIYLSGYRKLFLKEAENDFRGQLKDERRKHHLEKEELLRQLDDTSTTSAVVEPARKRKNTRKILPENVRGYGCNDCLQRFPQLKDLQYHIKFKSCAPPTTCEKCRILFRKYIKYDRHLPECCGLPRTIADDKTFICKKCKKNFNQKSGLSYHLRRKVCDKQDPPATP